MKHLQQNFIQICLEQTFAELLDLSDFILSVLSENGTAHSLNVQLELHKKNTK